MNLSVYFGISGYQPGPVEHFQATLLNFLLAFGQTVSSYCCLTYLNHSMILCLLEAGISLVADLQVQHLLSLPGRNKGGKRCFSRSVMHFHDFETAVGLRALLESD